MADARELAAPPASPVDWTFRNPATSSRATVSARTWFEARAAAAIRLGCEPLALELIK